MSPLRDPWPSSAACTQRRSSGTRQIAQGTKKSPGRSLSIWVQPLLSPPRSPVRQSGGLRWPLLAMLATACAGEPAQVDFTHPDEAEPEETELSSWVGTWDGDVLGYAAFWEGWDEYAYCAGPVTAVVSMVGATRIDGVCTLAYGPYEGEDFVVSGTGSVSEDGAVAEIELAYLDTDWGWHPTTVTGSAGELLELEGITSYSSSTGGDVEAYVELLLER